LGEWYDCSQLRADRELWDGDRILFFDLDDGYIKLPISGLEVWLKWQNAYLARVRP
jgi:hypothetical protein